jgi:hypothetical protein
MKQLTLIKKKYEHYINKQQNIEVNISNETQMNFYIVYYINCLINANYFDWLKNQIEIVYKDNMTIYIIATLDASNEADFRKKVLDIYPKVIIECNYINEYEYPAIHKVWELGQQYSNQNDIILYFHSKGMTHHTNYESNRNDNYNIILKDFDKIKEIFNIFPSIDKVGYFSGGIGWIWYNFWYARGSYINKVEKPLKTNRRHYYEDWLCRKIKDNNNDIDESIEKPFHYYENTLMNCYGFYHDKQFGNIGSYYCANSNKMFLNKSNQIFLDKKKCSSCKNKVIKRKYSLFVKESNISQRFRAMRNLTFFTHGYIPPIDK